MSLSDYSVLTIDVEDWYHVCGIGQQSLPPQQSWRVAQNIEKIIALLDQYQCKATFFMLGSVAEALPELAPMIVAKGHEIASHGYSHTLVTDLTKQQFLEELQRTEQVLVEQTGRRPVGYRAPQWSVSSETPWVDELLVASGYLYDSSRNPLPFVGDPSGPRYPYRIDTPHGSLWEVPPLVTKTALVSLPTGGGWGFRLFPAGLIAATIEAYVRDAAPAVLYLHPREVDPDGPRLQLPLFKRFLAYGTRTDATPRLSDVLQRFRFMTLEEMVRQWQPAS